MLKTYVEQLLTWYKKNFPVLVPLGLILVISLLMSRIPYLNLVAGGLSTILITGVILLIWKYTLDTNQQFVHLLSILFGFLIFLDIVGVDYLSETFANVFYLLLFLFVLVEIWRKKIT